MSEVLDAPPLLSKVNQTDILENQKGVPGINSLKIVNYFARVIHQKKIIYL